MSMPRAIMQAGGFFLVLFAVLLGYRYAAHCLVERVLSEAKSAPPVFEMKPLEIPEFKGLGDGIIYKPDRDHFGNR
jgi:hypothetical protein